MLNMHVRSTGKYVIAQFVVRLCFINEQISEVSDLSDV